MALDQRQDWIPRRHLGARTTDVDRVEQESVARELEEPGIGDADRGGSLPRLPMAARAMLLVDHQARLGVGADYGAVDLRQRMLAPAA